MSHDRAAVQAVLDGARAVGRVSLTSTESKQVSDAYGISIPQEGLATSSDKAATLAEEIGYPVVLKVSSKDILHKTEAGGVLVNLTTAADVSKGYDTIIKNAQAYKSDAEIAGVQVQQMLPPGQEVIVGAVTDPSFGKLVAFGLGGILVEVLKDVTFRLAPASHEDALSMIDGIKAAEVLRGVRGSEPVNRDALATLIENVSALIADFPEIHELDLNPVLATSESVTAVDVRILLAQELPEPRPRPSQQEILASMVRIMQPESRCSDWCIRGRWQDWQFCDEKPD